MFVASVSLLVLVLLFAGIIFLVGFWRKTEIVDTTVPDYVSKYVFPEGNWRIMFRHRLNLGAPQLGVLVSSADLELVGYILDKEPEFLSARVCRLILIDGFINIEMETNDCVSRYWMERDL